MYRFLYFLFMSLELLLRLNQIPKLGSAGALKLLKRISLIQLLTYDARELANLGWNDQQIQRWLNPNYAYIDPVLAWLDKSELNQVVTVFDADYPFLLTQITSPPLILYLQGDRSLVNQKQLAIVGS